LCDVFLPDAPRGEVHPALWAKDQTPIWRRGGRQARIGEVGGRRPS
jgi:hypothetical protein